MDKILLEHYARFAVKAGTNLQKGQTLLIESPIETAYFARICAQEAFVAGAKDVVVHYNDEKFARLRIDNAARDVLEDIKPWRLARYMDYAKNPLDVCRLAIYAEDPEMYKGLDSEKVDAANRALAKKMQPWRELSMANRMQWCVLSVPTEKWAAKVFSDESSEDAMENLWQAIFKACRIDAHDPHAAWQQHIAANEVRIKKLNSMNLDALHLLGENGTDLVVGLADKHVFAGIASRRSDGLSFLANIPTEEIFTAPHHSRVNGVVKSSLPYIYNGNLIKGITATFKNGVAVDVQAQHGNELMQQMMNADKGARRLGEVALVPASSAICQFGRLFYNTLYDENAACHIAFGAGYPENIQAGSSLTRSQLKKLGLNYSIIHEDVMVGTPKMDIVGIQKNGGKQQIFKAGEWVF